MPGRLMGTDSGGGVPLRKFGGAAAGLPASRVRADARVPASRGSSDDAPADWVSLPPDGALGVPAAAAGANGMASDELELLAGPAPSRASPRRAGRNISGVWVQDSRPGHVELIQSDDMEDAFRTRLGAWGKFSTVAKKVSPGASV